MIVRSTDTEELILIPQTDHSKLVGQLMAHWGNENFARPEPFDSVVRAATCHDFGWIPYESRPLFDAERGETPHYLFVANSTAQLKAYQDCTDWLTAVDPYASLLVNMHRTGLWQRRYDVIAHPKAYLHPKGRLPMQPTEEVKTFMAKNEAIQARQRAGLDEAQVWTNYRLLQVCDLLGLYFSCQEPDELYITPVPTAYTGNKSEGLTMTVKPVGTRVVAFEPFPFRVPNIHVGLQGKRLSSRKYPNPDAFMAAYFQAEPETFVFTLV
jgi:hypothetical protein